MSNMVEYPDLKKYVNIYFRITRKLTEVNNNIIRDQELLHTGITLLIDINANYFIDIIKKY